MAGNKPWIAKLLGLLALGVMIAVLLSGSVVWFLAVLVLFVCANIWIRKLAHNDTALGAFLISIGFSAKEHSQGDAFGGKDTGDAGGGDAGRSK